MTNSELADLLDELVSMICEFMETSSESFRANKCVLIYPGDKAAEKLGVAKKAADRLREADKDTPA